MKSLPLLPICLATCLGILTSEYTHFGLFFFLVVFVFSVFLTFFIENNHFTPQYNRIKSYSLVAVFFLFGYCLYEVSKKENQFYAIENQYINEDVLLGKVGSIVHGKSGFSKTEFHVNALLRGNDTIPVSDKVLLFIKDEKNALEMADVCMIRTNLSMIRNKNNPGEFDANFYWKHKGITQIGFVSEEDFIVKGKAPWSLQQFFLRVSGFFSTILEQHLSGDELGVAKALILGDRSSLDSEVTAKFGNTGAMHVLAVSGLHVGILIQLLTGFFAFFKKWINKKRAILLSLIIVWIYAFMTGLSASVLRSVVMFSLLVGSNLFERNYSPINVLAGSALFLVIWEPHFLFDIGFQLSYLAMLGIFLFYEPLSKVVYIKNKVLKSAYDGTMVGIAATIMTVPLTLYYFNQFPNYFILTNLGLMVFSFVVLVLGVSLFSFHFVAIFAKPIAWLLGFSLTVMLWIINWIDGLPDAVSYGFVLNGISVIILFGLIFLFYWSFQKKKMQWVLSSLIGVFIFITILVSGRFYRMNQNQLCFLNANEPMVILKHATDLFVFYDSKMNQSHKAKYAAMNFNKLHPGKIHLLPLHGKKSSRLKKDGIDFLATRIKGGYELNLNGKNYLFAFKPFSTPSKKTLVYASWIQNMKDGFCTNKGAIQFFY